MYTVLEDGFVNNGTVFNSTAASNVTVSLLSIVKAGAEAICGQDFFGTFAAHDFAPNTGLG
jgi:hypothetical protein